MDEINEAVVAELEEQKGHADVVAFWERIWSAYQQEGGAGVEALIGELLRDPDGNEENEA
jgi:hypothetical protein